MRCPCTKKHGLVSDRCLMNEPQQVQFCCFVRTAVGLDYDEDEART